MDIELFTGSTKAIISTKGGYVTNLADNLGDIFFPKRVLKTPEGDEKTRGGCHVCLPNFGPGGESGLDQHGFGRTSNWRIVSQTETAVELVLDGQGEYANMESSLRYEVQETAFNMVLTLKNMGESPLNVSPGFHPYFFHAGRPITLNDERMIDLAELAGTKFINTKRQSLSIGDRQLTLTSQELKTWAVWTDKLGDYICVEPTQGGNAFAEDIGRADTLVQGEDKRYQFTLSW